MTELKTEWGQYQSKQVAANIVVLLINERSGLCRPIVFVLNQYCSYEVSQYFLFLLGVNTDSVAEPERFFEETQLCLRYGWSLAIWATLQQTLSFIGIDNEQLIRTRFFFFRFFFLFLQCLWIPNFHSPVVVKILFFPRLLYIFHRLELIRQRTEYQFK